MSKKFVDMDDDFKLTSFILTAIILTILLVILICFLRAFMRFLTKSYTRRPNTEETFLENGRKTPYIISTDRRPPGVILRESNSNLRSQPRINIQPVRNYSSYRALVKLTRDETDDTGVSQTLLRHPDQSDHSAQTARPPSYQEAISASNDELDKICTPFKTSQI